MSAKSANPRLQAWVEEMRGMCRPENVVWCLSLIHI